MASIPNIQIWVNFFDTLRELPELWKVKSDIFKDRDKKKRAWPLLLDVYQKIEPNANIDSLKKRLTNIRTCYRRELRKVEQTERSGAEEEYVPNLWYFQALEFLRDQEDAQIVGVSTTDLEQYEVEGDQTEESRKYLPGALTLDDTCSRRRKKTVDQNMSGRNNILKEALGKLINKETNNKDDASVFAESWATSYRRLSPTQQIYAKMAIEEILVFGQLDLLTLNCVGNHSSNNSALHYSSLQPSRFSTPIFQRTLSSQSYENGVINLHVETDEREKEPGPSSSKKLKLSNKDGSPGGVPVPLLNSKGNSKVNSKILKSSGKKEKEPIQKQKVELEEVYVKEEVFSPTVTPNPGLQEIDSLKMEVMDEEITDESFSLKPTSSGTSEQLL